MKNKKVIILVESALCVALSTALSFFAIYKSPFGGDVTFASCLPIALLSYRRGIPCGIAAGFVYSIIQLLMGLENISYATGIWSAAAIIFLDYIIPFTIIGFSGMFRKTNRENTKGTANDNFWCRDSHNPNITLYMSYSFRSDCLALTYGFMGR